MIIIFGSFTIFNSKFFENLKTILLLNLLISNKFWTKKQSLKKFLMSSIKWYEKREIFRQGCLGKSSCFILTIFLFYDWTTSVSG